MRARAELASTTTATTISPIAWCMQQTNLSYLCHTKRPSCKMQATTAAFVTGCVGMMLVRSVASSCERACGHAAQHLTPGSELSSRVKLCVHTCPAWCKLFTRVPLGASWHAGTSIATCAPCASSLLHSCRKAQPALDLKREATCHHHICFSKCTASHRSSTRGALRAAMGCFARGIRMQARC